MTCTTPYGFLAPCQILEKTSDTVPRKRLKKRTEEQKDGQTLFCKPLPVSAGGPKTYGFLDISGGIEVN